MIIKTSIEDIRKLGLHYFNSCAEIAQSIKNPDSLAIWHYLQSHNASFKVIASHLQEHFSMGRVRYSAAIKYLKEAKLIRVIQSRDELGRIEDNNIQCYLVPYDLSTPQENDIVDSSAMRIKAPLIKKQGSLINKQERIKEAPLADSVQKPSSKTSDEALAICQLLDEKGISNAPIASDPELLFAIESGVTKAYFEAAIAAASHRKITGYKYILATAKGRLEDAKKPKPERSKPKQEEVKLHASHKHFNDERTLRTNGTYNAKNEHLSDINPLNHKESSAVPSCARTIKYHPLINSDAAFSNPDLPHSALQFLEQSAPTKRAKAVIPDGFAADLLKKLSIPRESIAR